MMRCKFKSLEGRKYFFKYSLDIVSLRKYQYYNAKIFKAPIPIGNKAEALDEMRLTLTGLHSWHSGS